MRPNPENLPVLDPAVIQGMFSLRTDGGAGLLPELVGIFVRDEPNRIDSLESLVRARDGGALRRAAHQLAGSSGLLGARQLQHAAMDLESCAAHGRWDEAPGRVAAVRSAWATLRAVLGEKGLLPPP